MAGRVRGVLFDLDGTLYDRGPCFSSWAEWFVRDRLGLSASREVNEAIALLTRLDAGGYGPKEEMFQAIRELFPILTSDASTLVAAFRQELPTHVPPLDVGTADVLCALNDTGLPWGIVTNGSRGQRAKVRGLGLEEAASCVVVSDVVGVRKPAPEIFRMAALGIKVAPPDILFVGDDPFADIVGAAQVGMQTAWIRRRRAWPSSLGLLTPDHSIDSLSELRSILRERA